MAALPEYFPGRVWGQSTLLVASRVLSLFVDRRSCTVHTPAPAGSLELGFTPPEATPEWGAPTYVPAWWGTRFNGPSEQASAIVILAEPLVF